MKSIPAAPSAADLKSAIERAGGTLIIPDPTMRARRAYRRAIHSLLNGDLLRPERCLRYSGRDRGDLVMRIEAVSEDPPVKPEPQPIPIPANLRSCHPIIQATREHERKKGFIDTCDVTGVAHLKVFADQLSPLSSRASGDYHRGRMPWICCRNGRALQRTPHHHQRSSIGGDDVRGADPDSS